MRVFESSNNNTVAEKQHATSKKITGIVVTKVSIPPFLPPSLFPSLSLLLFLILPSFFKDNNIYVCDRAGEVWGYNLPSLSDTTNLLLGQITPFTSLALSSDEKRVVTSDKDDRIRISYVPEVSFCFVLFLLLKYFFLRSFI